MIAKILLRVLLETACKLGGRGQQSLSGRATLIAGGRTTGNGEREREKLENNGRRGQEGDSGKGRSREGKKMVEVIKWVIKVDNDNVGARESLPGNITLSIYVSTESLEKKGILKRKTAF